MVGLTNNEINRLHEEDFIWFIYFFIIAFYLYSNFLEEKYLKNKNEKDRIKFRKINEIVNIIVFIIYLLFLFMNMDRIKELDKNCSHRKKKVAYLSMLVSILFVIAGLISLYLAFESDKIDNEIGII